MREKVVNIHDAKTQLSRLVARAELGPAPRPKRLSRLLDDPLLRVDEYCFDGPIGKITNTDIDRTVYGL